MTKILKIRVNFVLSLGRDFLYPCTYEVFPRDYSLLGQSVHQNTNTKVKIITNTNYTKVIKVTQKSIKGNKSNAN